MTSLIIDRVDEFEGRAAIHAIVIGISDYTYLPGDDEPPRPDTLNLKRLYSPARSALSFFKWLKTRDESGRLSLPLASCHLLLAPSGAELAAESGFTEFESALPNVSECQTAASQWRRFASSSSDKITIFYFAGHGLMTHLRNDSVIVLRDFGEPDRPKNDRLCKITSLINAMAPDDAENKYIARRQLYFVDACRDEMDEADRYNDSDLGTMIDSINPTIDNREYSVLYGTLPRQKAYGIKGKNTLFSDALLEALEVSSDGPDFHESGDQVWPVTSDVLYHVTKQILLENSNLPSIQQTAHMEGVMTAIPIQYLPQAPLVSMRLTLDPATSSDTINLSVKNYSGDIIWNNITHPPHPYTFNLLAGYYDFIAPKSTAYQAVFHRHLVTAHPKRAMLKLPIS